MKRSTFRSVTKTVKSAAPIPKFSTPNPNTSNNNISQDILKLNLNKTQKSFRVNKLGQFSKAYLNASKVNNNKDINDPNNPSAQDDDINNNSNIQSKTLKEMIETANAEQRAISLIEDTLELFSNQELKSKGNRDRERYELIDKEEFEKMKKDNEIFKQQRKDMTDEYKKIKEAYEKTNYELNTMNYTYYTVEKAKTDSITKIYHIENEVKRLLINNSKLNKEIDKEQREKENVFRALNEFIKKYDRNDCLPKELKDIHKKIQHEKYSTIFKVDHRERIEILENKINKMKLELEVKEKTLAELQQRSQRI